jgi:hypothetical protein
MLRPPVSDLHAYYADHFVEDERLHTTAHGRLEFERTRELLRRHLPPPPARVLDMAARDRIDDDTEPLLREIIATGRHDPRLGFTTAYFHLVDELVAEMRDAGLHRVRVYGVEGPLAPVIVALERDGTANLLPALRAARMLDEDPALVAASPHLLGVART